MEPGHDGGCLVWKLTSTVGVRILRRHIERHSNDRSNEVYRMTLAEGPVSLFPFTLAWMFKPG